jgi:hypothetical protein
MTSKTPFDNRSNYNHQQHIAQSMAAAELWRMAASTVRSGIARGIIDREVLATGAILAAQNSPLRFNLPGGAVERFLLAHQLGIEVVRQLTREVRV